MQAATSPERCFMAFILMVMGNGRRSAAMKRPHSSVSNGTEEAVKQRFQSIGADDK